MLYTTPCLSVGPLAKDEYGESTGEQVAHWVLAWMAKAKCAEDNVKGLLKSWPK